MPGLRFVFARRFRVSLGQLILQSRLCAFLRHPPCQFRETQCQFLTPLARSALSTQVQPHKHLRPLSAFERAKFPGGGGYGTVLHFCYKRETWPTGLFQSEAQ
jgi:hypothetical protein